MQPRASPSTGRPGRTGRAARSPCGRSRRRAARRPLPWWWGQGSKVSGGVAGTRAPTRRTGRRNLKCNHPRGLKSHFRCKFGSALREKSSPDPRRHRPAPSAETIGWDLWTRFRIPRPRRQASVLPSPSS